MVVAHIVFNQFYRQIKFNLVTQRRKPLVTSVYVMFSFYFIDLFSIFPHKTGKFTFC